MEFWEKQEELQGYFEFLKSQILSQIDTKSGQQTNYPEGLWDVRSFRPEIQLEAYRKGLIPYLPSQAKS